MVEQLDLAVDQLVVGTPVAARFALILVDNAVELVLHTSCESEVAWDRMRDGLLSPRYNEKRRREVLGQRFDLKAKLCRDLGMLSERQLQTVLTTHSYRNELYHTGVRYDRIILPLAWEYFGLACRLLPRIRVGALALIEPESERARKYFPPEGMYGFYSDAEFDSAAEALVRARPALAASSVEILAGFAGEQVEEVGHALDFLVADNFHGWNEESVLEHIQFHHFAFHEGDRPRIDTSSLKSVQELVHRMKELRKGWSPRYRTSPVDRWSNRANSIRVSNDWDRALTRFQRLRNEMAYLSEILAEAAMELDAAIQQEIDR